MASIQFDEPHLTLAKRYVADIFPDRGSSHLTEALAAACGFGTNAALRAAMAARDPEDVDFLMLDDGAFKRRLAELSGPLTGQAERRPTFDAPYEGAIPTETTGITATALARYPIKVDYTESRRARAWRNLMVAGVNACLDRRLFTLVPGDNRWPCRDPGGLDRVDGDYAFEASHGAMPLAVEVSDRGFDEVHLRVLAWPTDDGARRVRILNADRRDGRALAGGFLERRKGAWLQCHERREFWTTQETLDDVSTMEVAPQGYGDKGPLLF